MRQAVTEGVICLKDETLLIEYKVARIEYREWEDGAFRYEIQPYYEVIDLLEPPLFQGIPGINLDLRRDSYVRENRTPTFVSERAPAENREDVRALIEAAGMNHLNKLEWLIRTDTRYPGDNFYVRRFEPADEKRTVDVGRLENAGNRAAYAMKALLAELARGNDLRGDGFHVDDSNRKSTHALLKALYLKEKTFIDQQRRSGIQAGVRNGRYRGRKRTRIDDVKLRHLFEQHEENKVSVAEAAADLNVSASTLYRRFKELKQEQARQNG